MKIGCITFDRRLACAILLVAGMFLSTGTAFGQGFTVKPMKMEASLHPGETVVLPLEVRNTSVGDAKPLEFKLVDLSQAPDGSWRIIEDASNADVSGLSSCLKWVALSKNTADLAVLQTYTINVSVKVPLNARGAYFAGLIVQVKPPVRTTGLTVLIRYMVPIVVEIQGRPERQKIDFADVDMAVLPKDGRKPVVPAVFVSVKNEGKTFSRIKGNVKVSYLSKERWLSVANVEIGDTGILPASHLKLPGELGRSLPQGRYKLLASMLVDGRRVKPIEKEIDFAGDPAVTRLAVDTALTLDPVEITVAAAPGSTRTSSLRIQNTSADVIQVTTTSLSPQSLRGVELGNRKGDDYSCASWVEIVPAQFTVRPGGRQTVRVIAKAPGELSQPAYFALISLKAQYEDGQGAGETQSLICVENKKVEPKPLGEIVKTSLVASEASKYIAKAKIGNIGNCRFAPTVAANMISLGGNPVAGEELSGTGTAMLPLEMRDFSGELDLANVAEGDYLLRTTLDYGQDEAALVTAPIRISLENGQKVVTILEAKGAEKADNALTVPAAEPAVPPASAPSPTASPR